MLEWRAKALQNSTKVSAAERRADAAEPAAADRGRRCTNKETSMSTKMLNAQNFEGETAAGMALVQFHAEWCGPCRMMLPVVDSLAPELEGRALVARVDVDKCQELAVKFAINSVPTFVVLRDGRELRRHIGVCSKVDLVKMLEDEGVLNDGK